MRFFWSLAFVTCLGHPLAGLCAAKKGPEKTSTPSVSIAPEPVYHWTKSSAADGLSIYWSRVEGSQVIAFRGEGIVDCPIEKVASVIVDASRGTEWVDSLVASKVIREISPVEFIEYDHVGIPFPFNPLMADRDFVSRVTLRSEPETRSLTVSYLPTEDELAPPVKTCQRGTMTCVFKLVPMSLADQTYVDAEVFCDPKGQVAKWLVNFFQQGWPQTTFEKLRKQVKKRDIQVLPVITKLLPARQLHLAPKPDAPVPHPKRGMKRVHR